MILWIANPLCDDTACWHAALRVLRAEAAKGWNEALEGAVQHDKKLENEKFSLRLTAWPSEPPFINLGDAGRRLQQRAMTFQFTKVQRHSTQIYQQLLDNIVKLPTFQTLPASGGFLFAQASLTGNSELQWAHKFNWFYFHLRHEECHRKLLEVPPTQRLFPNYRTSDTTQGQGNWLLLYSTAVDAILAWDDPSKVQDLPCHWSLANSAGCKALTLHWLLIFQYLEARTFLESPKNSCHSAIVWQAAWWTCSSQRWDLEEIEQRNRGGPDAKCWRQRWIGLTSCVRKQSRYTRPARPTLFWAENVAATFWQTSCRWLSVFLWPTTTSRISSSQGQHWHCCGDNLI